MNAYTDHNFLINCVQKPEWRDVVVRAHASQRASLVLSPWHFYECGNAREHGDAEELLQFAEELQPKWTMERADLLAFEFWVIWNQLWESSTEVISAIGTFTEISAVLAKVDEARVVGITIRDFVDAFSAENALDELRAAIDFQAGIAASNLEAYATGRLTKSTDELMELKHVALQRARLEVGGSNPERTFARADAILREEPIATQLECFIYWRFGRQLRCHQTEAALTLDKWENGGALSVNDFVDRQHATVALPYCDLFITDDTRLVKRCNRVKARLTFPTAAVLTGEEFIAKLQSLL